MSSAERRLIDRLSVNENSLPSSRTATVPGVKRDELAKESRGRFSLLLVRWTMIRFSPAVDPRL